MAAGVAMETGDLILARNLSRQVSWRSLEHLVSAVAGVAIDRRGVRLAAWSKEPSRLMLITGIAEEPAVTASLDTSTFGEVVRVALGETALLVAVAAGPEEARVYLIPHDSGVFGEPAVIGTFRSASALLFDNSGNAAWIADGDANTVFSATDLSGAREIATLVSARDGVSKPVAVCSAGERLVVANSGDSTALVIHTVTSEVKVVPLVSSPTQCQRLNEQDLIAMNEAGAQPVSLLQAEQATSYFVPADAP
jgi:DNA-binding beta-propeller fold protein YncE